MASCALAQAMLSAGFVGVVAILALAALFSTNRRAIRLRIVIAALALQAALAALVLYFPAGRAALAAMSDGVQALINFSGAGISMVALKGLKPVLPEQFGQYLPG